MTQFTSLDLIDPLQRALAQEGYVRPTEIQARAIPPLLAGRDVLGCAQTGTGKTAAFLLPILQHLAQSGPASSGRRTLRALVLTPTRELAAQIGESARAYGRFLDLRHTVIFGGTGETPQIRALRAGLDLLVATPGRLLDLLNRKHVDLSAVDFFVLDEADRMLDMGFIHDVRRVIARLPRRRQNLLFSATLPPSIVDLAASFLHDPLAVEVTPPATTVERIEQQVRFVERTDKRGVLVDLLRGDGVESAIVFTRTKHGANRLAKQLTKAGIDAEAIHGNKSQGARTRTLDGFRQGSLRVLVATDLASRGLDVDGVSHVVNYELPNEPASYVHRIGRTGRAGRSGVAVSLCDAGERDLLRDIEREIGQRIPVDGDVPAGFAAAAAPVARGRRAATGGSRGGGPRGGGSRNGAGRRSGGRDGARGGGSRSGGARSGAGARGDGGSRNGDGRGREGDRRGGGGARERPAAARGERQDRGERRVRAAAPRRERGPGAPDGAAVPSFGGRGSRGRG